MIQEAIPELQVNDETTARRRSILIVDDDRQHVESLSIRLRRLGFVVERAYLGERALKLARENPPDLVLLDLRLPDIDGFHVCENLVDSPETCGVPVIIISGLDDPDVVRSSRAAGCAYFVRKPYDPNALLTLIQHALARDFEQWT
jgi:DNA-binding response OmpR family regulator